MEKHAPLRMKFIRGNHAPFINKELRKAIYTRSRLRNKFCKSPLKENEALYKKQRNKCVSLRRKSIKKYFNDITNYGIATNKNFWNLIKPFLTNKGHLNHQGIMIFDGKKIITNETELVEVFNNHYINIVEKSSGIKSRHVARDNNIENKRIAIQVIKKYFENHPSIKQIQENFQHKHIPSIPYTTTEEVKKLLKEVNAKKASGFDKIPPKLVKLAAGVLAAPLSKTINNSISKGVFPNEAKIALVSPLDKKTPDKNSVLNYRPVSILPTFSKIFGKVIKNYLMKSMDNFFSPYLSAYRASYSTQHVLLRLIEEWKTNLDNNFAVGAVLMDLSKAFDCIPHDLFDC